MTLNLWSAHEVRPKRLSLSKLKNISYPIHECPTYVLLLSKSLVQNFPYKNGNYEELELIKIRYNFQNTRLEFFVLALIEALIEALGRSSGSLY